MKNIVLATSLMFSVVVTTLPIYEQEREVLYAMHSIGQDFADAGFVKQNVDMFISIFQMNSQLLEKKLAVANQKAKKALWTTGGVLVATTACSALLSRGAFCLEGQLKHLPYFSQQSERFIIAFINCIGFGCGSSIRIHFGLDCYDAFKERNALKKALALDQEILEQLEAIKDLAMFLDENALGVQDVASEVAELE